MSTIEEKLNQLALLGAQLEEAKGNDADKDNKQIGDGADGSKPDAKAADQSTTNDDDGKDAKKPSDTSDEPKGDKAGSQIEGDDTGTDNADNKKIGDDVGKKKNLKVEESAVPKIDLGALFDGQDLSEDFKLKTTAVFEAAVEARVAQEVKALQESAEQEALEEARALEESLVEKVDGYLDYMVEQWMEKNALAVNRGIKTEILESFVSGLKTLFEDHHIDVPDEKYDLVEASQAEVTELTAKLDEAVEENVSLRKHLKETARLIQIEEAVDGLVETDAEKFRELAESLSYTTEEEYAKKLQGIRESYFSKTAAKTEVKKPLEEAFVMTDTPVAVNEESEKLDPVMAKYLEQINRK